MNRHITNIMLVLGVMIMVGCSATPSQEQTPKPEEPSVTAADAASALMAADVAIGKAKQRNNLWRDTIETLEKAEKAMNENKFEEARKLANDAADEAELAVDQSYHEETLFLITRLRTDYLDQMNPDQQLRLNTAVRAFEQGDVQTAYETSSAIMDEIRNQMMMAEMVPEPETMPEVKPEPIPAPMPEPKEEMASYTINKKDNLWDIAAKPEVYGNADMWPLLWKANKANIKRPDSVAAGTKLVIDRNASQEAVAAAIKHSKLRGAASLGPVDDFDQQYLNK